MRLDLQLIPKWVTTGSRVLDLGCGDGALLLSLQQQKKVHGLGLEIDPDYITQCVVNGVDIIEHDLNLGLKNFQNNSFDLVLMTHALQTLRSPHLVIDEMLRVGKECIVTFPNFGHWRCRWFLGQQGRMPVSKFMPYHWYDTPNIHFCTVKDFEALCAEKNIKILDRAVIGRDREQSKFEQLWPNLFGVTAVYHITK
ncbi:MAG: methionine biosynthesis protein MetW [Spongiibacteraceae bacterium]|nr:methionine biosynthesis protein MetW [Spongiibacteraceae bacterium]